MKLSTYVALQFYVLNEKIQTITSYDSLGGKGWERVLEFPTEFVFALAAASNSTKDPLFKHISLNIPSSLLIRFHGVSSSAT